MYLSHFEMEQIKLVSQTEGMKYGLDNKGTVAVTYAETVVSLSGGQDSSSTQPPVSAPRGRSCVHYISFK